ncbi:MAG: Fic family protein [Patescibacteria group bacterium]
MQSLAYTYTKNINDLLAGIEKLRATIHLYPLNSENEIERQWEQMLERIYWSLSLTNYSTISKSQILEIINNDKKERFRDVEKDILNYKKALDYIKENWYVSGEEITSQTIKHLYIISCLPTAFKPKDNFETIKPGLENVLVYLQKGQEHPLIQAAIAHFQILRSIPFEYGTGRVSRLAVYLFLYKYGYDFRGLLTFEDGIKKNISLYKRTLSQADNLNTSTYWLEYFLQIIFDSLADKLQLLKQNSYNTSFPNKYWQITKRQKEIIRILSQPGTQVSNKDVQKKFTVSQITASRDLSKLTKLGLLFAHGKGRAITYIRV